MVQIETKKELKLENILSLRKKMNQEEINQEMANIVQFFESNRINKNGPFITTTYGIDEIDGNQVLDMEIIIPMDKEVVLPSTYNQKSLFHIENAVYARHTGNPGNLQGLYNELITFIQKNNLQAITPGYNVTVKEGTNQDDWIIDVYIGVI